jgi:predicted ATPase/DNA-binding SARP family transcriptional activator
LRFGIEGNCAIISIVPRLEITLLGHPLIKMDGDLMDTDRRKAIALLAYLAVTGGTYTREQLATLFWPDSERESAFAYLRRTLWELNQVLGKGWIESDRETVHFNRESDYWLDTAAFAGLVVQHREANPGLARGVPFLETAISLYHGDFLAGFSVQDSAEFDEWQFFQAETFRREFAWALEKLVEEYERVGKYDAALLHARRWLALDALNEAAHSATMRLYAGMDDRAAAVRQYEACVHILKEELGVPPQPEITTLYEQIVSGDYQRVQPDRVSPLSPAELPSITRLPIPPTPFIGRHPELEQVKSLILSPSCRLLTLTGPGGTGKTRLSIQAASEINSVFSDGAFFVPLDSLNAGDGMVSAIAKALDFYFYQGEERPRQQLLDYFREKHTLLILDNFEHLIDPENLGLVSDMLTTAKGVKILTTSRARLNVQGEQLFSVGGLELPEGKTLNTWDTPEEQAKSYSALELFMERARRVQPHFRLTRENLAAVDKICRLVEGMPLGIELAAAWLELLPPQEIAIEITHSLDFLETTLKDVPERQRSLRAVFESSWKFLDEQEQNVFQKLSVFQGSFSRESAQYVSGASLRTLLGLANKSWVQQINDGRFQLHDLLRQYASELLQSNTEEWQAAKDRHTAYYAEFVAAQGRAMRGTGQIAALDAVAAEFDSNIRAAWLWLINRRQFGVITHQLMPGLFHFCLIRSLGPELIPLIKQARQEVEKETGKENQVWLAILMTAETYMETRYGILEDLPRERLAKTWAMVKRYDLMEEMGFWFVFLAREYTYEIAFNEGSQHFHAALPRIRARVISGQEDAWVLGWSLMFLGRLAAKRLTDEEIAQYLKEALVIFQNMSVIYEQALTLLSLGDAVWRQKKSVAESAEHYQAARQLFDQVGDHFGVATIWRILAEIYMLSGDFQQAFHAFREQGLVYEKIGNRQPPTGSGTFFGNRDLR